LASLPLLALAVGHALREEATRREHLRGSPYQAKFPFGPIPGVW
jgi:hypothetical protein